MYSFDDLKKELLEAGASLGGIRLEDIPAIDLYMDQVTTLIDEQTAASKRHPEDKPLTKSMIQNYTKNRLLPPPEKKKYSREHVILLLFIYYLKDFLSINDIRAITQPLCEACFQPADGSPSIEDVYQEVLSLANDRREANEKELKAALEVAGKSFSDAPRESRDLLRSISLIGILSYDILARKRLLEHLVDRLDHENEKARQAKEEDSPKDKKKKS